MSKKMADRNKYPKGFDAKTVREIAGHYDNQSGADAAAEDDAAYSDPGFAMIAVPNDLVPKVQKLIAKRAS